MAGTAAPHGGGSASTAAAPGEAAPQHSRLPAIDSPSGSGSTGGSYRGGGKGGGSGVNASSPKGAYPAAAPPSSPPRLSRHQQQEQQVTGALQLNYCPALFHTSLPERSRHQQQVQQVQDCRLPSYSPTLPPLLLAGGAAGEGRTATRSTLSRMHTLTFQRDSRQRGRPLRI